MRAWLPAVLLVLACGGGLVDDPAAWPVDTAVAWVPTLGETTWLIPSAAVPAQASPVLASNNNVDLIAHGGRLYLGWRTAPNHFASTQTRMHLLASDDLGKSWKYERSFALGSDVREPHFLSFLGALRFHFFQAGTDMFSFEPKAQWRSTRSADGTWSEPEEWGSPGEVTWDLKVRDGVAWRTSYAGNHYDLNAPSSIDVRFTRSSDGVTWNAVQGDGVVYRGGASEAAIEFDAQGNLWAVLRNEDGDATGFGSHVCFAAKGALGAWDCGSKSNPERYDSPKLFRHGNELYLVGRRDVGGPFDQGRTDLSFADQKTSYLASYWDRPKRTALFHLDRSTRALEFLFDFPSAGDTCFPSVVRLDAHRFLIANYSSPPESPDISWINGQFGKTRVSLVTLTFSPK